MRCQKFYGTHRMVNPSVWSGSRAHVAVVRRRAPAPAAVCFADYTSRGVVGLINLDLVALEYWTAGLGCRLAHVPAPYPVRRTRSLVNGA